LEVEFMAFSKHNFRQQGTMSRVVNVPIVVLKMVWGLILEEILAVHGVVHFEILPNL
jgi:hypothetical protein